MRIRIKHETRYRYGQASDLGPHLIRLRPAEHTRAQVLSYNLEVAPDCELRWPQSDQVGPEVRRLAVAISGLVLNAYTHGMPAIEGFRREAGLYGSHHGPSKNLPDSSPPA